MEGGGDVVVIQQGVVDAASLSFDALRKSVHPVRVGVARGIGSWGDVECREESGETRSEWEQGSSSTRLRE